MSAATVRGVGRCVPRRRQQQNDNVHVELTPVGSPPSWSDDDSDNILELDTSNNVNWHMEAAERDLVSCELE